MRPLAFASVLPVLPSPLATPSIEHREYEIEAELVSPEAVLAEATNFARLLAGKPPAGPDSTRRAALLHALVAQEIDFRRALDEAVPAWMLNALDETEWASGTSA